MVIPNVVSDQSFVCLNGCNLNAAPDDLVSDCQMGDYPTVWYEIAVDNAATVLNIEVRSNDFDAPVISVYKSNSGCTNLEQVFLTNGNLSCIIGADGLAKAIGTLISGSTTYYIAVSSFLSIGGDFEICVSTISKGSYCVISRDLQITARSNGGPFEGPFDPGEKITVCMNVNEFTAAGNGCQWFQGIVPVFGNGWDPTSFDSLGQPLNVTVNDSLMGQPGNGIYGSSIWDWFNNVGYHFDNSVLKLGDFDNNGRLDLCNGAYESDCPLQEGITGGCCGPCWDDMGDILPPGWFAYGVNGSCGTPGPPIKVDWGDGNTCGGGMGPWSFCFDLITRDTPDCLGDSTKHDLSIGFFTFADGEVGAWTGISSVCAFDQPLKLSFNALCGKVTRRDPEILPNLCAGDVFQFLIEEPGISHWEWNISPAWAVPLPVNNGENGYLIQGVVNNPNNLVREVKGIFIGHVAGSQDVVIRKISFDVRPCPYLIDIPTHESNEDTLHVDAIPPGDNFSELPVTKRSLIPKDIHQIKIYPMPAHDKVYVEWTGNTIQPVRISILSSDGMMVEEINVKPQEGIRKVLDIKDLAPGVYFINFNSSEFRSVSKLIKL